MNAEAYKWYFRIQRFILPLFLRGKTIKLTGKENLPSDGGFLLIGNHLNPLDHVLIWKAFDIPIQWLTTPLIGKVPFVGWIYRKAGMIFIGKRYGNYNYKEYIIDKLRSGNPIGIFPEGVKYIHQNDFTAPMYNFHPGFASFAWEAKVPVVPLVIIPIDSKISRIKIPYWLRKLRGESNQAIKEIQKQVVYSTVEIKILESIPVSSFSNLDQEAAIEFLLSEAYRRIQSELRPFQLSNS